MSLASIAKKLDDNNILKNKKRDLNVLYQHKKDMSTMIYNYKGYIEKI